MAEASDPGHLLTRINDALDGAASVYTRYHRSVVAERNKSGGDPVTEVDLEIDRVLKAILHRDGEGWLSEETADDARRLEMPLTWVVDPLDGTREFVDGLPEFCTSIAAVVDGEPIAGGVLNPAARLRVLGAAAVGITANLQSQSGSNASGKRVLASRSEVNRGQWEVVRDSGWDVVAMGSVAYKLARVAAGLDPATWTPVPKHEWDVAGGAALIRAAGGRVTSLDLEELTFNNETPWLSGAIAVPVGFEPLLDEARELISHQVGSE